MTSHGLGRIPSPLDPRDRPASELLGAVDGPKVQERWPGRYCDVCRATDREPREPATHARDSAGGGRDFYCDEHVPAGGATL